MKVAISATRTKFSDWGRSELIELLQAKGHSVCLMGQDSGGDLHPELQKYKVQFLTMPLSRSEINPIKEINAIIETYKTLEKNDIEALIAYGIRTFPTVVIAAKMAGIHKVLCIVNAAGRLFNMTGIKGLLAKVVSYPMLSVAFLLTDQILFQNPDDLKLINSKKLLWRQNYGLVNGSGVNLDTYRPSELNAEPTFVMIGRLIGNKGINEYIKAATLVKSRFPETRFDLVGPMDNDDSSLDIDGLNKAVQDGVVTLHGEVDDVRPYIKRCRIFVLPSYFEGVPRTVLEAMAMGRPIITTDAPGCRETVVEGVNGFKIPVKDASALAEKMIWMINHREKVEEMGKASRKICEDKFDVYEINELILNTIAI